MVQLVLAVVPLVEWCVHCDGSMCHCVEERVRCEMGGVQEVEENVYASVTGREVEWRLREVGKGG